MNEAFEKWSADGVPYSTTKEVFEAGYKAAAQKCIEYAGRGESEDQMTWEFVAELRKELGQ